MSESSEVVMDEFIASNPRGSIQSVKGIFRYVGSRLISKKPGMQLRGDGGIRG